MEELSITNLQDNVYLGEWNPGNGTNYKVIAIRWMSDKNFNCLGAIDPMGWLVVNCNNSFSHLFQGSGYLLDSYIREKLGGNSEDYPYFGDLVRKLINRENSNKGGNRASEGSE